MFTDLLHASLKNKAANKIYDDLLEGRQIDSLLVYHLIDAITYRQRLILVRF